MLKSVMNSLFITLIFISTHAACEEVRLAPYGITQATLDLETDEFEFKSNNGSTTRVNIRQDGLRFDFFDGSFLVLKAQGSLTRYSQLTGETETFTTLHENIPQWEVHPDILNILDDMADYGAYVYEYTPPISGGDCRWEDGQQICTPPILDPKFISCFSTIGKSTMCL